MPRTFPDRPRLPIAAALASGAVVFLLGLTLARLWLPEWQAARPADRRLYAERFREIARRTGVRLDSHPPRIRLASDDKA
ncbi:MAG: hypothetical protein M3O15_03150, partial [Acidobacteriota bacterium]|nr:hypothetical protein [Acidobacteriota bacterium]